MFNKVSDYNYENIDFIVYQQQSPKNNGKQFYA